MGIVHPSIGKPVSRRRDNSWLKNIKTAIIDDKEEVIFEPSFLEIMKGKDMFGKYFQSLINQELWVQAT